MISVQTGLYMPQAPNALLTLASKIAVLFSGRDIELSRRKLDLHLAEDQVSPSDGTGQLGHDESC